MTYQQWPEVPQDPAANPTTYPGQYPAAYPGQYPGANPQAYPQPYPQPYGGFPIPPAAKPVPGLAQALRILIAVSVLISLVQTYGWWREYALIDDIQAVPGSVSLSDARAADNLVALTGGLWLFLFIGTAIVFLVWFYRVRQNAGSYHTYPQRRSQGWAIGGWICPFIALVYPYQMTSDVLMASDSSSDPKRSLGVVKAWWGIWLLADALGLIARLIGTPADISTLKARAAILALSAGMEALAAILVIVVIMRISNTQQYRHLSAHQPQTSW
jgi:hypothetical protein